jgi:drug/metabolite transporter (DMT)-like permease
MTTGIEYALGAMLCFGIGDLIYKRASVAGALPHHLLMVQSWVFLPSVVLFGLLTNALEFTEPTLWGSLAGLFMTIGFYNFAHSLRSGSISVNAPIFRLSFVITALLAVGLFGEPLSLYKAVAITLELLAVWFLLAVPGRAEASLRGESYSSLLRVILATISVGIGNVIYKFGLRAGATPASLIVAQAVVVVTLSTALAGVKDRRIRPSGVALRFAPAAAVVLAFAFAFLIEGLARGDASVVVPITQMGFGVTALIGILFLREPFTIRKGLGLLCALTSLATFAYGLPPL